MASDLDTMNVLAQQAHDEAVAASRMPWWAVVALFAPVALYLAGLLV